MENMKEEIESIVRDSIKYKKILLEDEKSIRNILHVVNLFVDTYKSGGKILFCGNGGSAADAQHISAELSGRFLFDRQPLFAEALHVNSSYLTAVANDYGFDVIYSRLIEAKGDKGDILVGITTSGKSKNVINGLIKAREIGMKTIGLTGSDPREINSICDNVITTPSASTPRIQEMHIMIGHIVCEMVEKKLFS